MGMGPYKIKCTLWREGDKAIFDFAGTDLKLRVRYFLNEACSRCFRLFHINVVDPQIVFNDGFYGG